MIPFRQRQCARPLTSQMVAGLAWCSICAQIRCETPSTFRIEIAHERTVTTTELLLVQELLNDIVLVRFRELDWGDFTVSAPYRPPCLLVEDVEKISPLPWGELFGPEFLEELRFVRIRPLACCCQGMPSCASCRTLTIWSNGLRSETQAQVRLSVIENGQDPGPDLRARRDSADEAARIGH